MVVIFEFTMDGKRVEAAHWEEGDCMVGKVLAADGSIKDERRPDCPHLSELAREVAGGQGQAYAAEVDDVRSALKYLGKSTDLVRLLPHVDVHDADDAPYKQELPDLDDPSAHMFKPNII
jgi:hypothetical protein